MGLLDIFDNVRRLFSVNTQAPKPPGDGAIERQFGARSAVSERMVSNIQSWYRLYINDPPWRNDDVHPLGLPGAIGREFARNTLSEFSVTISGGPRADYLNDCLHDVVLPTLQKHLEMGLCLGGIAFRPYIDERGRLMVGAVSATAFTPTEFDGTGMATAGVFREVTKHEKRDYCRLEYHSWDGETYVIQNKAYTGTDGGGEEVPLETVSKWALYQPETRIEHLTAPLFAYFRNPSSNDIEPESQIGVSIYGGLANMSLLQQADAQWERLIWEFQSGERKIFNDGPPGTMQKFDGRLFERGMFTADGNLFSVFSPEFRHDALYSGFQWILQRIEYNVGMSFGTLSDPQSVEKTATEILAAKNRQRMMVSAIQRTLESVMDSLIYAMDTMCSLYSLAPIGDYETTYNWGDGVLDDPETIRQDKAQDLQEIAAGIMAPWEYRVKWYKETEEEAKAAIEENDALDEKEDPDLEGLPYPAGTPQFPQENQQAETPDGNEDQAVE